MFKVIASTAVAALLSGCSLLGIRSGTEEPRFDIVEVVDEQMQIRRYAPRLAAETEVETSNDDDGRNAAFRRLAGYIFGKNRLETKIAMTTPVETRSDGAADAQKIAMTTPVETRLTGTRMTMRFTMPAAYTRDSLPAPLDPLVRIVELPPTSLAVLRFTGARDVGTLSDRQADLLARLAPTRWKALGEPFAMLYDPPWTPPFLRRNEVAVAVDER